MVWVLSALVHVRPGELRSDLSPLISLITDSSSCYWNRDNAGTVLRLGTDAGSVSCCIMNIQNKPKLPTHPNESTLYLSVDVQ